MRFTIVTDQSHGASGIHFALFLMFLAALSILLERWLHFRRLEPELAIEAAGLDRLENGFGFELQQGAMDLAIRSTREELGRGLRTLLTLSITLPLVGVLGTLSLAMALCRGIVPSGDGVGTSAFADALSEALVPTAVGLALGLVSFWSYTYLQSWLDRLSLRMTRHASVCLRRWRDRAVA